jgi:hypothetical protein
MRKYLGLPLIGVCLLVLLTGTTAFAGTSSTYYAGKNSQGQKLLFSVDQTANGPRFDPFFTTLVIHCPATGNSIIAGFSFSGFEIPIKNGKFSISLNDISDLFTWSGTVTPKKATGTETYDLAAFAIGKGLQDCASGTLPWSAQALVPASSKTTAPHAAYNISITKAADGSVHYTVTH